MQDEIKKVGRLTLYDEPYEKTVSDSGIVFYNLDINTAVLEFTISKNNFRYKSVMRTLILMCI